MSWNFRTMLQQGTESALDVSEYFLDEVQPNQQYSSADAERIKLSKYHVLKRTILNSDAASFFKHINEVNSADVKDIVNIRVTGENTLLHIASQAGNAEIVGRLFDCGADGNIVNSRQHSCLHAAVQNSHASVVQCILDIFPELVQQTTIEHWSPLHAACINGHFDIARILIEHTYPDNILKTFRFDNGTWECRLPYDPNLQDVTGQTPLYVACLLGNTSLVNLLLNWKVTFTKTEVHSDETTSTPSTQNTSPSKRRVSLGIQSIMDRLYLVRDGVHDLTECDGEVLRCPLERNQLCGAPRETALLAAVRGGYTDVVALLLSHGADANIMARPMEEEPLNEDMFTNSPLAEATRQASIGIVDLLLNNGAFEDIPTAMVIACANRNESILGRLLARKSHADPEYKINKQRLDNHHGSLDKQNRSTMSSAQNITYSTLFPTNPVMVNWHFDNCQLNHIRVSWLLEAVQHCNPKFRMNAGIRHMPLGAITRIDISHNAISHLPLELFFLCSLRNLNIAANKLEKLPVSPKSHQYRYDCPLLEELYLQDNRLEEIPAAVFGLPALVTLDVSNNKLQSLPYAMWMATKLRDLNVAFNLLKDLPYCSSKSSVQSGGEEENIFQELTIPQHHCRRNRLTKVDLVHHSVWSKNLEVSEQDMPAAQLLGSPNDDAGQLTYLNLANNLFTSVPLALPCLAINLTRLNMSYNSLRSMGHVTSYPASLRQLDLSHNEITCWPSLPSRITTSDPHLACYNSKRIDESTDDASPTETPRSSMTSSSSLRSAVLKTVCSHRKHLRLESLRTLILADNLLTRIQLTTDDITFNDVEESDWSIVVGVPNKLRLMFPNLSMLDISNNCLKEIPHSLHELTNLSVLNISGNIDVTDLPPNMGLLSRLWNLNTRGCSLQGPLRSMIDNGKYKTMDIIGYLKSVYEDAKPYARMKLMVVGTQGIGKTSLLELLRQENGGTRSTSSGGSKNKTADHWTKRIGNASAAGYGKNNPNISTVGVDIGDWVCEKKVRGHSAHGPVVFRTWDFGGQKEYYTTHQYFLSKRSLYIVVWRVVDGKSGLAEVLQWLGNIQARAPNSPVLIVATHHDAIGLTISAAEAAQMQQTIRDRFIAVTDAEKMGLPRVIDSIEVSCKTNHNITMLANLVYDVAFSLRSAGSKELLLHQKVPSTYLALEDVIGIISHQLRQNNADPVLNLETFKEMVAQEMAIQNHKGFRDSAELNQATMFLHDNGVILHYDDATLRDLYFVDPQWLCDMLAHVVTIREINPFARNGIMRLDDLQHIFKGSQMVTSKQQTNSYIVNLLNKFEVALTWDSRTLLIPSLLPISEKDCSSVKIVPKLMAWQLSQTANQSLKLPSACNSKLKAIPNPNGSISRLLLMSYFPSGFWSRLLTRILADIQIISALKNIYPNLTSFTEVDCSAKWHLWQTGIALCLSEENHIIFKMREVPENQSSCISDSPYRNPKNQFQLKQDDNWCSIDLATTSILEIHFPAYTMNVQHINPADGVESSIVDIAIDQQSMTQMLALCVDHIDILLEDWYPTLGTRFVHTSEGRFLVTRLIPCPLCLQRLSPGIVTAEPEAIAQSGRRRKPISNINYTWMMEECILAAYEQSPVLCPNHSVFAVSNVAPDIMFRDLHENYLIDYKDITKGSLLGRGAFGFVFKATCRLSTNDAAPVALKMLQPVQPGPRAKETAVLAYKAILGKWKRDPLQHACKAYCMARQELSVIMMLKHPNIVGLVGVCVQPLAIVLEWAPKGALDDVIREFRRSGSRIGPYCFQHLVLQASRAIEYLHRKHIIYRDLKAENVLVWEFPETHDIDTPSNCVFIKIADYGISRVTMPSGTKGFGGTEGFMAPEIMKYNGEEEYTEKVDCFSFGMFLYELIALRQPFEGHEAVKECILEGGRPVLTRRETQFPCYCLDLMVLCWDQLPKARPSASQIVSIASAPEFTHLIDVVSLSHNSEIQAVVAQKDNYEDDVCFEIWLSCLNFRIELLTGSKDKWLTSQRILNPSTLVTKQTIPERVHLCTMCSVGESIWLGDSESNIHVFNSSDCSHVFSYTLEPAITSSPITLLVELANIKRVAAGLENGRLFLLDSSLIPSSSTFGEGSFVLTELGTGDKLFSAGVHWINDNKCELWCGIAGAYINIFSLQDSVVSERQTLSHFDGPNMADFTVSLLYPSDDYVFSYVSPGCVLYQWNAIEKKISNRLDCSKLVPCSESLNSISIEEHLSPGKCQITAMCKLDTHLYVGTSWGCIVVIETDSLRPITIFRPFEEEVRCILPITNSHTPLIATFGRGYRSLIRRYTDCATTSNDERYDPKRGDRSTNIHALIWKAEHWVPV